MFKSRNFKVDTDVRLRMLEQHLKAQADELSTIKTKLAVTEEKLTKQSAHEEQIKTLTETVNALNAKLTRIESTQTSAPELPGGLTPEEVIQEMYRMCGLGDDK